MICSDKETKESCGRSANDNGRVTLETAPGHGAHLRDTKAERGLKTAEIGNLLGIAVEDGRLHARKRPHDRVILENVDLVALRILGQRNLDRFPAIAVATGAAHPFEADAASFPPGRDPDRTKRSESVPPGRRDEFGHGRIRMVPARRTD